MKNIDIIQEIDIERLYHHIMAIEGVRHPIEDLDLLNASADYIKYELDDYGYKTNEHVFQVQGIDEPFKNIEGYLGDGSGPELLVTSHYDTISISPGANDNASGVAGMLEIARVIAENGIKKNIRFISFTLEENHPRRELEIRELMMKSGLVDDELRFLSYHTLKWLNVIDCYREEALQKGKTIKESWSYAKKLVSKNLTKKEKNYVTALMEHYSDITRTNWIGESICVGSTFWVKDHLDKKENIIGVLNLEEIGYRTEKKYSQTYPDGINPVEYQSYKANIDERIGDFVGIFSDKHSINLAQVFCNQCRSSIDLPYHNLAVKFDFNEIALKIIDLLRSDHAPFWRENIPAISITDTFEFRYPFYHSSADSIDMLDFDFMRKICQATLATVLYI